MAETKLIRRNYSRKAKSRSKRRDRWKPIRLCCVCFFHLTNGFERRKIWLISEIRVAHWPVFNFRLVMIGWHKSLATGSGMKHFWHELSTKRFDRPWYFPFCAESIGKVSVSNFPEFPFAGFVHCDVGSDDKSPLPLMVVRATLPSRPDGPSTATTPENSPPIYITLLEQCPRWLSSMAKVNTLNPIWTEITTDQKYFLVGSHFSNHSLSPT